MFSAPSALSAPVLPSVDFALRDQLDQEFGYLVDESDMGYWDSGRCSSSDWDSEPESDDYERFAFVEASLDYEPLDTDDYEYQQALLY